MRKIENKITAIKVIKKIIKSINIDFSYFIRSGFWVALREIFVLGTGLLVSIIFARLATKETYGEYQLILSILSLVSLVSMPGLSTAIIRSTARGYDGNYKRANEVSFLWSFLAIPIISAFGVFYILNENEVVGITMIISSFFFPFLYGPNKWEALFLGQERFDLTSKYGIIQTVFSNLVVGFTVFLFPDKLLIIILAYLAISCVFNVLFFKKSLLYLRNDRKDETTLSYGYFLTKINFLSTIAGNIDKIVIGFLLGSKELAIYTLGVSFVDKFHSLLKSFLAIPSIKMANKNVFSKKNIMLVLTVSFVISTVLFLSADFLITVLFTKKYLESIHLSKIIIVFIPFYVLDLMYKNHFIFFLKKEKVLQKDAIILPAIKILLTILLVNRWKSVGLAYITGLIPLINIILLFLLKKQGEKNQ